MTDQAVRAIMRLQGAMAPAQIISLLDLGGATFAMGDHHDHIHVGYQPGEDTGHGGGGTSRALPRRSSRRASGTRSSTTSARSATRASTRRSTGTSPANLSCKYKRAMEAQGARVETKPLKSIVDLAAAEKPLIEVVQARAAAAPVLRVRHSWHAVGVPTPPLRRDRPPLRPPARGVHARARRAGEAAAQGRTRPRRGRRGQGAEEARRSPPGPSTRSSATARTTCAACST